MCSRGKNIRVKENLENKRSKWKQQQCWTLERRTGLVTSRDPAPGRSAGRRACGFIAPPWKFGIKERQTAGKDGLNGLVGRAV